MLVLNEQMMSLVHLLLKIPLKNINLPTDVITQVGNWPHHSLEEVSGDFFLVGNEPSLESNTRSLINLILV